MPKPRLTWDGLRGDEENRFVLDSLRRLNPGADLEFEAQIADLANATKLTPGRVTRSLLRLQNAGVITCKIAGSKSKPSQFRILRDDPASEFDPKANNDNSPPSPFPPDPLSPDRDIKNIIGVGECEGEGQARVSVIEPTPQPASPALTQSEYPELSSELPNRIASDLNDLEHLDGYQELTTHYSEDAMTAAWRRTAKVPRVEIRTSPFNLFRWFLRKHGQADFT